MPDNITIKDASGSSVTLGSKDNSSVHYPKHIIVNDSGNIAQVVDVDGALDERTDGYLATASILLGIDAGASAGSQAVPVEVESTASPNIRATLYSGDTKLLDAAARRGYVQLTDGTNTTPAMDAAARPGFVTLAGNTDSGLSAGKKVNLDESVQAVKASAGQLYDLVVLNNTEDPVFVQVFNVASGSVTLATTVPDLQFLVPSGEQRNYHFPLGWKFSTAISIAATKDDGGGTGASDGVTAYWQYK